MIDWHALQVTLVALGGVAPTGSVALLVVVALGLRGAWRQAAVFVIVLLAVVGVDVASKLFYYARGVDYGWATFRAASGHAVRSAAVYPAFGWVVFSGSARWRCAIAVTTGVLIAAAVAFASVDKGNHTAAEVCVGGVLGLATLFVLARKGALKPLPGSVQAILVVAAVALCVFVPATRYDFEHHIRKFARRTL